MFSLPDSPNILVLHGKYVISIVILSVAIACCASFTALTMNQRMKENSFFHKNFWLFLSSIAMGLGIWSMHFIGMSAFMLPVPMKYNLVLTLLSAFPAIFASYLAFYFANRANSTHWPSIISGIIMGLGISAMHYVGMAAMEMKVSFVFRPWLFFASIAIAIIVSYVAIYVLSTLQKYMGNQLIKIVTSVIMGVAITSMHYTGMSSVIFYVRGPLKPIHSVHEMAMPMLITSVTVGIAILLIISGLTSLLDRYVDYRLNYTDALTLYPNQRQFEQDLTSRRSAGTLAIIHVHNLERWINSYGYTFGDKVIKTVGDVIRSSKRRTSTIYRIEGNRFALLDVEEQDYKKVKKTLEDILSVLTKPVRIDTHGIIVEMVCSISYSGEKRELKELFSDNIAVLQHESIDYTHEVIEYDPKLHTYSFERQLSQDIDRAMTDHELFLEYQPKVCSETWEVTGVEALLRWNHPLYGKISPGIFVPILEESGKIYEVTDWVIHEVCQQISLWLKDNLPFHHVSINVPGPYVTSSRLTHVISQDLLKHKIDSHFIELEITETSVIHDIENAIKAVNELRKLGLSVALDDFGTGLSSLSYLRRIPITTIKIDKSFVDEVPHSEKDSAVLNAIITLSSSLNLTIVIEGVETQEQIDFITSTTVTPHIQGYYFSRPLVGEELKTWMRSREATGHLVTN